MTSIYDTRVCQCSLCRRRRVAALKPTDWKKQVRDWAAFLAVIGALAMLLLYGKP